MSTSTYLISGVYSWGQFAPVFWLVGLAVALLLADTFLPRVPKQLYPIGGAIGAGIAACFMLGGAHASAFGALACGATALCLLLAWDYRAVVCASVAGGDDEEGMAEFAALPLLACAGICGLIQAKDLAMLFVCLETVTLSSYALAGYFRRNQGSIEAGVKYLVLGALSTGIFVFGAAWFFGTTGSFALDYRLALAALNNPFLGTGFLVAMGMLLMGAFFKVGAAPAHTWIPDVYQGAPTPVSAFLAVASKVAGFVVLLLLCRPLVQVASVAAPMMHPVVQTLAAVAAATLLVGNLGALGQQNAKRLLGYSSIGQAGFILVFFVAMGPRLSSEVFFYLLAYGLATIPAFYAIAQLRRQRGHEEISAFRGLGKTNPRTAFLITVSFASLAGVPLTGGFLAKFSAFRAFVYAQHRWEPLGWWLLPIMVICAAAGFYYYFKVLRAMYWERPQEDDAPVRFSPVCTAVLALGALALVALGTLPLVFRA